MHRIITHGGCLDGFCSAFVFKKYFAPLLQLKELEIIQLQPQEVQSGEFKFTKNDVVLDLPRPRMPISFWCDHHLTQKPKTTLPQNYYWKPTPSCTGFLIGLALQQDLKETKELLGFKKAMDTIDGAEYTRDQVQECYYDPNYQESSVLLQLQMIGSMFGSRDQKLNEEIFRTLLNRKLQDTPLQSQELWQLNPEMFHRALMQNYQLWRKHVDSYLHYDDKARCVVQDDRKVKFSRGVPDRFYAYMKYPDAKYNLSLRWDEKMLRVGIGSNIFHKEWCTINLGELCREAGKRFGNSSGGGHYGVGGATILSEKGDEMVKFVLERMGKSK